MRWIALLVVTGIAAGLLGWLALGREADAPTLASAPPVELTTGGEARADEFESPGSLLPATEPSTTEPTRVVSAPSAGRSEAGAARDALPGPHGAVVAASGAPLAGVTVSLGDRKSDKELDRTTTDENGFFSFDRPTLLYRKLEVVSEDWYTEPPWVVLDAALTEGQEAVTLVAHPLVRVPLQVQVLDARTGEPIPAFALSFKALRPGAVADPFENDTSSSELHLATTDAEGRVSLPAVETGVLRVGLEDDAGEIQLGFPQPIEIEHSTDAATAHELLVLIGPTYRLDLKPAWGPAATDCEAAFLDARAFQAEAPSGWSGNARAYFNSSMQEAARIRDGAAPWARFRKPLATRSDAGESDADARTLFVRSRDGLWSAEVRVHSTVGIYPHTLSVDLEPRGSLVGTLRNREGETVSDAWVRIDADGSRGSVGEAQLKAVDDRGRFRFDWLTPGPCTLHVVADRYDALSVQHAVVEGERSQRDLVVRMTGARASLRGRVTGSFPDRSFWGTVAVVGIDREQLALEQTISGLATEGTPFEFADLPHGRYRVELRTFGNSLWSHKQQTVTLPTEEEVVFERLDESSSRDLAFAVRDATGDELSEFSATVWLRDGSRWLRQQEIFSFGTHAESGEPHEFRSFPGVAERPLTWAVRAAGTRLALGDESSFRPEGERWVAEVQLSPGWGRVVQVYAEGSLTPIEGARALVNGVSLEPLSDASGLLWIDLDEAPDSVRVTKEGWRSAVLETLHDDGEVESWVSLVPR